MQKCEHYSEKQFTQNLNKYYDKKNAGSNFVLYV